MLMASHYNDPVAVVEEVEEEGIDRSLWQQQQQQQLHTTAVRKHFTTQSTWTEACAAESRTANGI